MRRLLLLYKTAVAAAVISAYSEVYSHWIENCDGLIGFLLNVGNRVCDKKLLHTLYQTLDCKK